MGDLLVGLDFDENGTPTAIAVVLETARHRDASDQAASAEIWFLERLSERPDEATQRMAEIADESAREKKRLEVFGNVTAAGRSVPSGLRFGRLTLPWTPVRLIPGDGRPEGYGTVIGQDWLASRLRKLRSGGAFHVLDAACTGNAELQQELRRHKPGNQPGPLGIALGIAAHGVSLPIERRRRGHVTLGLDLDERHQPAAMAVVERGRRPKEEGRAKIYHDVWLLEHLPARPDKAMRRMGQIIDDSATRDSRSAPMLYVNVTGPGKPALEMLRFNEVTPRRTAVYLTDGDERVEVNGSVRLGRGWLVSRLQELLPTVNLNLDPARARAKELTQELLDYRPGDEPGPLMNALGLAVQEKERTRNRMGRIRTF